MSDAGHPPNQPLGHKPGRTRWTLLDWDTIDSMARVMTTGAAKHGAHNWLNHRHPELADVYLDKVMRHLSAMQRGEYLDGEDGELHAVHALCDLMVIAAHQIRGTLPAEDRDDAAVEEPEASKDIVAGGQAGFVVRR